LISSAGGKTNIIRWDQIEVVLKDIKADSKTGFSRSYTVCLRDSSTWTFTSELSNVEELAAIVEDKVTRHFLPRTLAAYHAGRPVHFADTTLISQGISGQGGRRLLPWRDVDRLHIDDAAVSIYKIGEFWDWSTTPTSKVPNVGVLKRLVDQIMRERANSQLPRVIAIYKAGLPVVFGRLSVSLRGIDINYGREMLLPWSEIASIGVGESEVIIERKETLWEALPLSMISDAWTLKELLDYRFSAGKPRSFMPGMKRRS